LLISLIFARDVRAYFPAADFNPMEKRDEVPYVLFLGLSYRLKRCSAEGRRLQLLQVMMDLTAPEA
jgi:hypothetical protein